MIYIRHLAPTKCSSVLAACCMHSAWTGEELGRASEFGEGGLSGARMLYSQSRHWLHMVVFTLWKIH